MLLLHLQLKRHLYTVMSMHKPDSLAASVPAMPHIVLEKVEYHLRQSHLGFKSSPSARSYNITGNHRRQVLATTTGHPARWNDKTVVLFDDFIVALNEGTMLLLFCLFNNYGTMVFQVFGMESSDIMTLAMLIVTFVILFVEFCHARSLSDKHQRLTDIDASVGDNFVSHNCLCYFFSPPGMTFLESVRAHELVVISGLLVY
jgi:hypothetical protein